MTDMTNGQDPFSTFDWDFADRIDDAARYTALSDRSTETAVLMAVVSADSIVHFALWSELPKNHPVAELWLETQTDLVASIYLAYGGFFRQALTVLRSWFEIALHGVFFSAHYGQPSGRYEQWRQGKRNAPANIQVLAQSLASRADKLIEVDESTIFQKLQPIYSFLSQHTHGQGLDIYDLQEGRDNVPRYLPKSFDIWYQKLLETFGAVCFLYRIFFAQRIASYLAKSKPEMDHADEVASSLSGAMLDFEALMADVFAFARS